MKWFSIAFLLSVQHSLPAQDATIQTQIKQIALLKIYTTYIEQGYTIARKGLKTISDSKGGHWKMDIDFFNSLKTVNPKIKQYAKLAAALDYAARIIKQCSRLRKQSFNADETPYINTVIHNIIDECETATGQLSLIITDGELQMTGDARIKSIDRIFITLQDQYSFTCDFIDQAQLLIRNRAKEKNEIQVSKKLNGV